MLPGSLVDIFAFEKKMNELSRRGPTGHCKRTLLGITKASLATESFLSAACSKRLQRVLTDGNKGQRRSASGLKRT